MGQPEANLSKVVLEYLRYSYANPKLLFTEIYPLFKKRYSRDTFRRLICRTLNRLEKEGRIAKHPLRPYYCGKEGRYNLDSLLRLGWFHQIDKPMKIYVCGKPDEWTFERYYRWQH